MGTNLCQCCALQSLTFSIPQATGSAFAITFRDIEIVFRHPVTILTMVFLVEAFMANLKLPSITAFIHHVARVVIGIPEPEVCRINARRIVATGTIVQNPKTIWDWTVSQFPRVAVRSLLASAIEFSVPSWFLRPEPAAIRLGDERPESGLNHFRPVSESIVASIGAKVKRGIRVARSLSFKRIAAVWANAILRLHRRNLQFLGVAGPGLFAQLAASFILPQQITLEVI